MKRLLWILLLCAGCAGVQDEKQLLASARTHLRSGEVRSAIIELKNVLQQHPQQADARLLLGSAYLGIGDVLAAEKELQRALDYGAPQSVVWPLLGEAMLARGTASVLLTRLEQLAPSSLVLVMRANAHAALGKADLARDLYQQALQLMPSDAAAMLGLARLSVHAQDHAAALQQVDTVLQRQPDDTAALRLRADILRLQGKPEQALQIYQKLRQLVPGQIQPQLELATLQIQLQQYPAAHETLDRCRALAPQNLLLVYTLALLDVRENKLLAARDRLQMVLRAAPDYAAANLLMGTVQRGLSDFTQAERYLRTFLSNYPHHPYALRQLAAVQLANQQAQQALETLAPLLAQQHQDVALLALAGEAHMRLRHYAQATQLFTQASALAPDTAMLQAALAIGQLGMGKPQEATRILEHAAALDAKSTRVGVLLVLSYLRQRDYDKAQTSLLPLLKQYPDNPMLHNLLGGVQLMRKELASARSSFEQALRSQKDYLPALDNLTRMDLAEKQGERARLRLEAVWAQDRQNTDLLLALANLAAARGQREVSGKWLQLAVHEHPESEAAVLPYAAYLAGQKQTEKASSLLRQLLASQPDNRAALSQLAGLALHARQFDAALASLNRLAALQPGAADIPLRIAAVCNAAGRADCTRAALQKALSIQPGYLPAQVAQIQFEQAQRQYASATQLLEKLKAQQRGAALPFQLEGDLRMAQQRYDLAAAAYQQAQRIEPSAPTLQRLYAAQLRRGKVDAAQALMLAWLSAHPDDQLTRFYWSDRLIEQKDYQSSQQQLETLVAASPDAPLLLNNLAWVYQQRKDGRALPTAERAARLAPDNPLILDTLGWLLHEQGERQRSLTLLQRASAQLPANASIRQHLDSALAANGTPAGRP